MTTTNRRLSGVSTQRNARNVCNARDVTQRTQQTQLRCTLLAIKPHKSRLKYEIIEIKFDLHHILHNK